MADRDKVAAELVLRDAMATPEGKMLLRYLQSAQQMPTVGFKQLPEGIGGYYLKGNTGDPEGGLTGTVQLNKDFARFADYADKDAVALLLHELTHAAQTQMDRKGGPSLDAALQKLAPAQSKLRPQGEQSPEQAYRIKPREMQAFGIGNSVGQPSSSAIYRAPTSHMDATMAQEFMILLDLAIRDQQTAQGAKPVAKKAQK